MIGIARKNENSAAARLFTLSNIDPTIVEPDRDTPDRLRDFAKVRQLNLAQWELLTGDKEQIYHVGKDMLKADGAPGASKNRRSFTHTTNLYLIDKKLRLRGIYDSTDAAAMKLLVRDIAALNHES